MSEIKSCEEYVVVRLQDVENELEKASDLINKQDEIIQNLQGALTHLMTDCIELRNSSNQNMQYFDIKHNWSDGKHFDFIKMLYDQFHQNEDVEEDTADE